MQETTPQDILLHTLHCALETMPPSSGNRASLLQAIRYAQRSFAAPDNGQRRTFLRLASAHLKQADKDGEFADEQTALSNARRAMTAALFEYANGSPWVPPQVDVRYIGQDHATH